MDEEEMVGTVAIARVKYGRMERQMKVVDTKPSSHRARSLLPPFPPTLVFEGASVRLVFSLLKPPLAVAESTHIDWRTGT